MIYTPKQLRDAELKEAVRQKLQNYRGKGHNKTPHNKMKWR